ncbi:MAG: tagaturonate reductase, partial [Acholeplasmataceae bacterium]|nr:tagaturonate reductase [Acholeplasmataceae bacterium]
MHNSNRKEKILQFGSGNFLRGFIEPYIQKMNELGYFDGSVVIVKPTPIGTIEQLNNQNGKYTLFIRGLSNYREIKERIDINIISRAVNPYSNFKEFINLSKNPDLRFIISNTTESGYELFEKDSLHSKPAQSFPGKLLQLLYERYKLNLKGFIVLPCELIHKNGLKLKELMFQLSFKWGLEEGFRIWLEEENLFVNTLVDRIVTGFPKDEYESLRREIDFEDKLMNVAEVYNLWVIESNLEHELPLQKSGINVIWTKDIQLYEQRKVRILNGAHILLVTFALVKGYVEVRASLLDNEIRNKIEMILKEEIIPSLNMPEDDLLEYMRVVIERFLNPYIHHKLTSIALNA